MDLIFITNNPTWARTAAEAGVDRVMVDLEKVGKQDRQGHLDTLISEHSLDDVAMIRAVLPKSTSLMVRTDPWPHSQSQIEYAIDAGADRLMLPMFEGPRTVEQFVRAVGGRVGTVLLLETKRALLEMETVLAIEGIDEVHVGLNDLHLALGKAFMFELLADGTVEAIAKSVHRAGPRFGFGGVARVGGGPLRPELILSEHARLGSSMVILSRDFNQLFAEEDPLRNMRREVGLLRQTTSLLEKMSAEELKAMNSELCDVVENIARTMS